jgi:phage terminase large subunit-like protein
MKHKDIKQSQHYKDVTQYCDDIKSGKIQSGQYTKKAIKRFLSDIKCVKDEGFLYELIPQKADEIIDFAENLYIPDINRKLELLPWMKFIYYNLFGWVHKLDNNRRRFRSGYIEVARKNSKTTSILFPIILYDFLTTNAAESYFVSADEKLSYKTFQEILSIIREDKELSKIINDTISAITYENNRIMFFSAESKATDGYKPSCTVIDEFHNFDRDKVVSSFILGGRARPNNLVLIITSAGLNLSGPCYAENEKAKKLLNGVLTDETYFTIIYAYDEKDNWKDKKLFIKANPSLGPILKPEILETDLASAIISPSHQSDYKAKTCGIWNSDISNWIPLQKWDTEIRNKAVDISEFEGEPCCCGLDLSSIQDFTAYTKCFKKGNLYYLFHKFYVPSEQVQEKYLHEHINIRDWIERGLVISIPGPVIDYDFIEVDILKDNDRFNIIEIAYDAWGSNKLIDNLEEKIPRTTTTKFEQSLKKMTNPTKEFERLVMTNSIVDSNPVMLWMVTNAVIQPNVNGDYKPLKKNKASTERIDGVVSSIMAIERCNQNDNNNTTGDFDKVLALFNWH